MVVPLTEVVMGRCVISQTEAGLGQGRYVGSEGAEGADEVDGAGGHDETVGRGEGAGQGEGFCWGGGGLGGYIEGGGGGGELIEGGGSGAVDCGEDDVMGLSWGLGGGRCGFLRSAALRSK